MRRQVPPSDPGLFSLFRKAGGAEGAFTTYSDDSIGCGDPGVPAKIRKFSEYRLGAMEFQ